jgi:hypothetical protein
MGNNISKRQQIFKCLALAVLLKEIIGSAENYKYLTIGVPFGSKFSIDNESGALYLADKTKFINIYKRESSVSDITKKQVSYMNSDESQVLEV